jgi:hypothetical protein
MTIETVIIDPRIEPAVQVKRPMDMTHKDFMLMQKTEWNEFHRVIIGKWNRDYHKEKEIEWWCDKNIRNRWFHSEGFEVFYFEDFNSAVYFKLRWYSELIELKN